MAGEVVVDHSCEHLTVAQRLLGLTTLDAANASEAFTGALGHMEGHPDDTRRLLPHLLDARRDFPPQQAQRHALRPLDPTVVHTHGSGHVRKAPEKRCRRKRQSAIAKPLLDGSKLRMIQLHRLARVAQQACFGGVQANAQSVLGNRRSTREDERCAGVNRRKVLGQLHLQGTHAKRALPNALLDLGQPLRADAAPIKGVLRNGHA